MAGQHGLALAAGRMIPVLRSLAFYLVFYGGSVVYVLTAVLLASLGRDKLFQKAVRGWSRFHRRCARILLGIEVVSEGAPLVEPALYAIRHESFFEAIDAPMVFDLPVPFAKEELFAIPGWGKAASAYGLVPVARTQGAATLRRMIRQARDRAAEGRPLIIFPEGTRVPHGQRGTIQSGFAGIYKMIGLPVVPVAVNSGPLYHRKIKRSGQITYRFGAPIEPGLSRAEIEARVQEAINALNG
ncbi:1-acyl-sn-glycerol-3-phosphate acyltransferase [Erythrobacter sp. 3-20A1M]|uniref:lysophospholipid acyltransferase family protein n=1 Tax=Erythrobacter sp. 3-20A1M TaxID=2653850 RepID=UPI00203E1C8D|nr:lysophospholipid acyltransferase family protein [Erythrobacter sp. 3-20A1M]